MYSADSCATKSSTGEESVEANKTIESNSQVASDVVEGKDETNKPTEGKKDGMRKGKWTPEEERYTNKVIEAFNAGLLKLTDNERGITLRAYLAAKLGCDPMRITKKYTGASCLGKRVYHAHREGISEQDINRTAIELQLLEASFRQKLMQMSRKRSNSNYSVEQYNHMISTPAIDAMLKQGPAPAPGMWGNVHDVNGYPYPLPHPQYHPGAIPPGMYPPPPSGYQYLGAPGALPVYPPHLQPPPPHYHHAGGMYPVQYDPYQQYREQEAHRIGQQNNNEKGNTDNTEYSGAPSMPPYGYPPKSYYGTMAPPYPGYGNAHYPMHIHLPPQQSSESNAIQNSAVTSVESHSGDEEAAGVKKRPRSNSQGDSSSSTPHLSSIGAFQVPVKLDDGTNQNDGVGVRAPRRMMMNIPLEDDEKLKTTGSRDGESGEAANSLLGFFNKLEKNNSQQDLVEFFEGVQKSAASALSPAHKAGNK